jgi:hypothetical protein
LGSSICDPRQYCCNTLMKDLFKLQLAIGGWHGWLAGQLPWVCAMHQMQHAWQELRLPNARPLLDPRPRGRGPRPQLLV